MTQNNFTLEVNIDKDLAHYPVSHNNESIFNLSIVKNVSQKSTQPKFFFPALKNFKLEDNIDEDFGHYPPSENFLLSFYFSSLHIPKDFMPAMTGKEKLIALYVIQNFINGCHENNISFFIGGGTLLGSIRHHGFIPWDDDLDIYVDQKDRWKLIKMDRTQEEFSISYFMNFQWKFSNSRVPKLFDYPYRWPYVDIFFYEVKDNIIYDVTSGNKIRIYDYEDVFPIIYRPFEGAFLPSPRRISKTQFYSDIGEAMCKSSTYIHKHERPKETFSISIKCSVLYNVYPFVFPLIVTSSNGISMREELKVGDKVLNTIFIDS
ncbi:hypothetical protein Ahia01_000626200 [Argonauta hians]